MKNFLEGRRRGQFFGAFTAVAVVILFLAMLFLLPLINDVAEAVIVAGPITDPLQQFFIRMFGIILLLTSLFSVIGMGGAYINGQFGGNQ